MGEQGAEINEEMEDGNSSADERVEDRSVNDNNGQQEEVV